MHGAVYVVLVAYIHCSQHPKVDKLSGIVAHNKLKKCSKVSYAHGFCILPSCGHDYKIPKNPST